MRKIKVCIYSADFRICDRIFQHHSNRRRRVTEDNLAMHVFLYYNSAVFNFELNNCEESDEDD